MAFGQSPGPPATGRQLRALTELVEAAGYADWRDARGALGLNQRQAGGRFTRDEADELLQRLEGEAAGIEPPGGAVPASPARLRRTSPTPELVDVPDDALAAELQHRGWVVLEP